MKHLSKTLTASLVALAIGAGSAAAVTKALITLYPGDMAMVPSRGIECGVVSNPNAVLCFRTGTTLSGTYSVAISRSKVEVIRNAANHGSRIVYSVKQPKS